MGTEVVRIGVGAIVGVQVAGVAVGAVPRAYAGSSSMIVLALAALYLMWGGRVKGPMGDVVDGVAIGIAAMVASSIVRLPVGK